MNARSGSSVLLVTWLVGYVVVGGVVFLAAGALLRGTSLDDTLAVLITVGLTVLLGWLGASWIQRLVAARVSDGASSR